MPHLGSGGSQGLPGPPSASRASNKHLPGPAGGASNNRGFPTSRERERAKVQNYTRAKGKKATRRRRNKGNKNQKGLFRAKKKQHVIARRVRRIILLANGEAAQPNPPSFKAIHAGSKTEAASCNSNVRSKERLCS